MTPEASELERRTVHGGAPTFSSSKRHIILEPCAYCWYRVGGLGHLLDRTDY